MKKITIMAAVFLVYAGLFGMTSDEASIEALKYKKESAGTEGFSFVKRMPDFFDAMLLSDNAESYYEIARAYYFLELDNIAARYFSEYEKRSDNGFKKAWFMAKMGDINRAREFLMKEEESGISKKNANKGYILEMAAIKGLEDLAVPMIPDNVMALFSKENDKDFANFYYQSEWSAEEKSRIKEKLVSFNMDNYPERMKIFINLSQGSDIQRYYFAKIKNLFDVGGYSEYFLKSEEALGSIEPRGVYERLYYYKYKGEEGLFRELMATEKEAAKESGDTDRMYNLYGIEGNYSADFKMLYNLAVSDERYLYRLIKELEAGKFNIEQQQREELIANLTTSFSLSYPSSKNFNDVNRVRIATIKDVRQRVTACDEFLAKKYSGEIFKIKIETLASAGMFVEAELAMKVFFEKYPVTREAADLYALVMMAQNKKNEALAMYEKLADKTKYFELCDKTKTKVSDNYRKELIKYNLKMGYYDRLGDMKKEMSFEELLEAYGNGAQDFLKDIVERYPFAADLNGARFSRELYFNAGYGEFNTEAVKKLIDKADKNDAEKYYLARYFVFNKDYKKGYSLLNEIVPRYRIYPEFIKYFIETAKNCLSKEEIEKMTVKYNRALNW